MKYSEINIEEIYEKLESSKDGLTSKEAKNRIDKYGQNILPKGKKNTLLSIFLEQFVEPITLILLVACILSFFIKEYLDGVFILIVILLDAITGTVQEWKANRSAESLKKLIKSEALVLRDGKEIKIDSVNLVVGDIIILSSGDKLSCDARIISCYNLTCEESVLTGESVATEKTSNIVVNEELIKDNVLYAGTSVITGRAIAIVIGIATDTVVGSIAKEVINMDESKSPLVIRTEKFTKTISIFILIISLIMSLVLYVNGNKMSDIFFIVVALAISAIPEGLSMALTLALSIASGRMSKKNIIVKKLNSVESLGSCTVIATDKTGTLTVNEQTAKVILLPDNSKYEITGVGYNDNGKVVCDNKVDMDNISNIAKLGSLNNEGYLSLKGKEWNYFGDSIDVAFLALSYKLDMENVKSKYKIEKDIPYESANKYSAVLYNEANIKYWTAKGSIEKILEFCTTMKIKDKVVKIDKDEIIKYADNLSNKGYRVIAISQGSNKELKNMTLLGLIGFIDPIRKEAKEAIKKCKNAGIKVVMITGDHPLTAFNIASVLGLANSNDEVVTQEQIAECLSLGEKSFDNLVAKTRVFSRVTPMQKLEIVKSFKRMGEFVAVTGDGVNDAPALKTASIGVSMGSGTDVAKEVSNMILLDDSFNSLVDGIEEGRIAYNNIRKVIFMLLSCGISEILFFLLSIILNYPIPLVAVQLLWLNLVTDGLQDVALACERTNEDVMKKKPRDPKENIFNKELIIEVLLSGIVMGGIVFAFWIYLLNNNMMIDEARGYILMLMVFMQNIHVLNCRSENKSIFKMNFKDNPFVIVTICLSILLQIIISEVPFLSNILSSTSLPFNDVIVCLILSLPLIVVVDMYKIIKKEFNN